MGCLLKNKGYDIYGKLLAGQRVTTNSQGDIHLNISKLYSGKIYNR